LAGKATVIIVITSYGNRNINQLNYIMKKCGSTVQNISLSDWTGGHQNPVEAIYQQVFQVLIPDESFIEYI